MDRVEVTERLNELKAALRGLQIQEDEALAEIAYCNERRPILNEQIWALEDLLEQLRSPATMQKSDLEWGLKKIREWTNNL